MKKRILAFISLCLLTTNFMVVNSSSIGNMAINTVINGRIKGAMELSPKMAHIQIRRVGESIENLPQTIEADSKGGFELTLKETGIYQLRFSAVDYQTVMVPVWITDSDKRVSLDIVLSPQKYMTTLDEIKIIGDWNNFNPRQAETMQKEPDGTFVYEREVTADTVKYQIMGATDNSLIPGTMADGYEYDNNGNYRAVIKVVPGRITIIFDPAQLHQDQPYEPNIVFDKDHQEFERLFEITKLYTQKYSEYLSAFTAYRENNGNVRKFSFDSSSLWNDLDGILMDGKSSSMIRQYAAFTMIEMLRMNPTYENGLLDEFLNIIPPESPIWSMDPSAVYIFSNCFEKGKAGTILWDFYKKNPDHRVQAQSLVGLVKNAKANGDKANYPLLYQELNDKYRDIPEIQYDLKNLNPDKKIAQGKPVPDFQVLLLEPGKVISNLSLRGKFYLIDFWASWCGNCGDEMPFLHAAYQKYKDRNFEILSLSFDQKSEDITKFRLKWPMLWLHGWVANGFESELAQRFEVAGIPRAILVGPDGNILATENLRGESLEKTLEMYLVSEQK